MKPTSEKNSVNSEKQSTFNTDKLAGPKDGPKVLGYGYEVKFLRGRKLREVINELVYFGLDRTERFIRRHFGTKEMKEKYEDSLEDFRTIKEGVKDAFNPYRKWGKELLAKLDKVMGYQEDPQKENDLKEGDQYVDSADNKQYLYKKSVHEKIESIIDKAVIGRKELKHKEKIEIANLIQEVQFISNEENIKELGAFLDEKKKNGFYFKENPESFAYEFDGTDNIRIGKINLVEELSKKNNELRQVPLNIMNEEEKRQLILLATQLTVVQNEDSSITAEDVKKTLESWISSGKS